MRKGQVSAVFMMIFALIVAVVILFFGVTAMINIINRNIETNILVFSDTIANDIEEMQHRTGSINIVEYNIPGHAICFVDSNYNEKENTCLCNESLCSEDDEWHYNAIICDAWKDTTANMFIFPRKYNDITINNMEIVDGYFCIYTVGKTELQLEGRGDSTLVYPVIE